MFAIPAYIQTLTITDEIDRLIIDDGYKDFNALPDYEQNKLAAYSMDALGVHSHECIVEAEDFEGVIAELRKFLLEDSTENALDLAEHLRNNTREYFKKTLAAVFAVRYAELEEDRMRQQDLHPIKDAQTGETRWIK